jgi:glycosyltransferase 2 family protein
VLRSWRGVLSVMGLSIGAWAAEALMYYIIGAWGFGLDLPVHAYTITTAIANLSTLVPSSPGYFGVFDTVAKVVLVGLFKLDSTMALSYVALLHAALYFPVTLWGVYYMVRESVSWSELAALEKKEAAGQPAVEEDDSGANARGGSEGSGEMLSVPVGGAPAGVRAGERDTAQSGPR